jgi:hypothetical protein
MELKASSLFQEKDTLTYSGIHKWIARVAGNPMLCESCGDKSGRKYHWANLKGGLSGKFTKNRSEWKRMCVPCHKRYDLDRLGDKKKPRTLKTHCKMGHEFAGDNLYVTPKGYHDCRTCRKASVKKYKLKKELLCK